MRNKLFTLALSKAFLGKCLVVMVRNANLIIITIVINKKMEKRNGDELEDGVYKVERIVERWVKKLS